MDQHLAQLLVQTQSREEAPRKAAELHIQQLYSDPGFPHALVALVSQDLPVNIRQSALFVLKKYVDSSWSPNLEGFDGHIRVSHENKAQLRQSLLDIALSDAQDRKIKSAASLVVSKVATADFPEEWPDLMPNLLYLIPRATDGQLHGALKLLLDLVDDCLNEEQFFKVARELVSTIEQTALDESKRPNLRALAITVFRSCFNTLEMILESHRAAVTTFAEEALTGWTPFILATIRSPLPQQPKEDEGQDAERFRGLVSLKLQSVKLLGRIRNVFPSILAPQSSTLFWAIWSELDNLRPQYHASYIEDDRQGRLEDADGLPYTLDWLAIEDLDFMRACLRSTSVRKELQSQSHPSSGASGWITNLMELATHYAQITVEEEGLWDIDVNVFLTEESSVTANYTPRSACGDLAIKLGEWVPEMAVSALLARTKSLYESKGDWKAFEAALFLLNVLLKDLHESEKDIAPASATGFVEFVNYALQHTEPFLRARGHLVAGSLIKSSGSTLKHLGLHYLQESLSSMVSDESDVVKASCVQAVQSYLSSLEPQQTHPLQRTIISSLAHFLNGQDLDQVVDSEDVMVTFLETLRDTILLDTRIVLSDSESGLDLLFLLASRSSSNYRLAQLISETFQEVASTLANTSAETFSALCAKVLPSLMAALDDMNLERVNELTNLAAEMLSVLIETGFSPLPQGFVGAVMPKLHRILLASTDDDLLRSATSAVQQMVHHDSDQVFSWRDVDGKEGLEVLLVIIDRLLSPTIDDYAGGEVGGLTAEVVEKAGGERLGPFLPQLLRAIANRLVTAERIGIIQSLILVFAKLSIDNAREVVDFLSQTDVRGRTAIEVVLPKWLENSTIFVGFEDIKCNIIALTRLYDLSPSPIPLITVQGDMIMPAQSSRIVTRSRAEVTPTQFTSISADLKIIKVLIEELLPKDAVNARSAVHSAGRKGADGDPEDDEVEDDGWEDDDDNDFLDLGTGMTKEQLMGFGEGKIARDAGARDDETQRYLVEWFRGLARRLGAEQLWEKLTEGERERIAAWL